jgi:YggT family protein
MNAFLYNIINNLFNLVQLTIFIEVILSWVPNIRENQITRIVHSINEPFLKPGRYIQERIFPNMMIDFSPIIALLIISVLKRILFAIL